jgi:hypothetical protein
MKKAKFLNSSKTWTDTSDTKRKKKSREAQHEITTNGSDYSSAFCFVRIGSQEYFGLQFIRTFFHNTKYVTTMTTKKHKCRKNT